MITEEMIKEIIQKNFNRTQVLQHDLTNQKGHCVPSTISKGKYTTMKKV